MLTTKTTLQQKFLCAENCTYCSVKSTLSIPVPKFPPTGSDKLQKIRNHRRVRKGGRNM